MTDIRKPLQDKIIADLGALTYSSGNNPLFAEVQKLYVNPPQNSPSAYVMPFDANVTIEGNDFDQRVLGWIVFVYEHVSGTDSQTTIDNKVDRLNYIEDALFDYVEKIPNNLEHAVSNVHVLSMEVQTAQWNLEEVEGGVAKTFTFIFNTVVNIDVKTI